MLDLLRLKAVIRKEFRQLRRDPQAMRIVIIAPIIQLFVFGYAATTDLRNANVVICDQDRSSISRQLCTKIESVGYFTVRYVGDPRQLVPELDKGIAQLALSIPEGFARDIASGRGATLQLLVDGSDSNTATVAATYLTGVIQDFGSEVRPTSFRWRNPSLRIARVRVEPRIWYNPDLRSANYMLPALVGLILTILTTVLMAFSIVREREQGTLEQVIVTPLQPAEMFLGKMLPVAVVGFVDAIIIVIVTVLWFHVPLRGSVLLLFTLSGGLLLCTLGLGMLISTVSRTQQQALMLAFFFNMPQVLLSGFIFPIANMPVIFQVLTYFVPLRYFLVIVRGIYLKGVGIDLLWREALALFLLGALFFFTGVLFFRKRVD